MDNKHLSDDTALNEEQISSQTIYSGRIIDVCLDDVRLPDGKLSQREYVKHRGGACILAVDEDDSVYLVRQYRYPYGGVITEIPAGKLEIGEEPAVTAARELEEEVGIKAEHILPYGILYPTPGYTNERIYVFLATGLKKSRTHFDDEEFLNVVKMPFTELLGKVVRGEIHDAKTCYATLKYAVEARKSALFL